MDAVDSEYYDAVSHVETQSIDEATEPASVANTPTSRNPAPPLGAGPILITEANASSIAASTDARVAEFW